MIELNQAIYARLVQLYIVVLIVALGEATYGAFSSQWWSFSTAFDALVVEHFGDWAGPDWFMFAVIALLGIVILGGLASTVGLLWFKRWARTGFWLSTGLAITLHIAAAGWSPSYSTPVGDALGMLESGLFGAILLLSYAKGYGAEWFARPMD